MKKTTSLGTLLLVYLLCALATFYWWRHEHTNGLTGDEPHYLIMANGIAQHGAIEQTLPYVDAFKPGQAQRFGLPPDAWFTPKHMHTIIGEHGHFNMHNLGVPVLLALPFTLGGMVGAKLFMICCGSLAVLFCWKTSALFASDVRQRWLATLTTCIGLPLLPAVNQIYPDVLGGVVALLGLYWFCTTDKPRGPLGELALAIAVACLPWLQIKFGPACAALMLAVMVKIYIETRNVPRVARILGVAALSCLTLAGYNLYAFGKISGPYLPDAVEVSKTSFMVLFGLHLDQNQGFLMQNPVNLLGLLGIGWLYRSNRPLVLLWAVVFLSLIAPNAFHPNWYGGWCFSGRFGWAGAVVFMIPTLFALLALAKRGGMAFGTVVSASVLLQAFLFFRYVFVASDLYNRGATTPFAHYSLFYGAIHSWLPAMYNSGWAFDYAPNYWWVAAAGLLLAGGFVRSRRLHRTGIAALCVGALALLAWEYQHSKQHTDATFAAAALPSNTGQVQGETRVAEPGRDAAGFINYGPYLPLTKGRYRLTLKYSADGTASDTAAQFDIYYSSSGRQLYTEPLPGTHGQVREFITEFAVPNWTAQQFEFRNMWSGKQRFTLYQISVKEI